MRYTDKYWLDLVFDAGFPLKYAVSLRQMSGWLSVGMVGEAGVKKLRKCLGG